MRRSPRFPLAPRALAAALTAALASGGAGAEDAKSQAARIFQTGSEAYQRKDFRTAGRAFDDAYKIAPRGAAAYNGGLAWEGAGERARAADDYTLALEATDLGAAERADATGRLRALEQTLAHLEFAAPRGSRLILDEVELAGSSASVHVAPGKHALRVDYPDGHGESRTLLARAGTEQSVRLGNAPEEEAPGPATADATSGSAAHDDAPPPPPQHDTATSTSASPDRTTAWIVLGGAVLASGIAFVVFEEGLAARNGFVDSGDMDSSLRDRATALRTATWLSWGVAGALAATGVVLYFTASPPSPSRAAAGASVSLDGHGATFRVGF